MTEIIRSLPFEQLQRIKDEAEQNPELEASLALVNREMARRALLIANDATGACDALDDIEGMVEPSHIDQQWSVDYDRETNYIRGSD